MRNIVITGSTRGIGHGLAASFMDLGAAVVVSGRTRGAVDDAVEALAAGHPAGRVVGQACDVTDRRQLQALWDASVEALGGVDIWINNAGVAPWSKRFADHTDEDIRAVVGTNLIGAMNGCAVAIQGMTAAGGGAIYNMEGFGSDGRMMPGLNLYGTSKRALRHLNGALAKETHGTPVLVGAISPGMVVTDLLVSADTVGREDWERTKKIFNILADRVETVTPWLARRMLDNRRNGARIAWLTRSRAMGRFLLAPFRRRDLFAEIEEPKG